MIHWLTTAPRSSSARVARSIGRCPNRPRRRVRAIRTNYDADHSYKPTPLPEGPGDQPSFFDFFSPPQLPDDTEDPNYCDVNVRSEHSID